MQTSKSMNCKDIVPSHSNRLVLIADDVADICPLQQLSVGSAEDELTC